MMVFVAIGLASAAVLVQNDAAAQQTIETLYTETNCLYHLREQYLSQIFRVSRFLASGNYANYDRARQMYTSRAMIQRQCLTSNTVLQHIDYAALLKALSDMDRNTIVSMFCAASKYNATEVPLFSDVSYSVPPKTLTRMKSYEWTVPNIAETWLPYSDPASDVLYTTYANSLNIALETFFGSFGEATILLFLDSMSSLIFASSQLYTEEVAAAAAEADSMLILGVVSWAAVILFALLFWFSWHSSPGTARIAVVVALVAVACIAVNAVAMTNNATYLSAAFTYASERQYNDEVESHWLRVQFYAYQYILTDVGNHALEEFLSYGEPIKMSTYEGALLLRLPFAALPSTRANVANYIAARGSLQSYLIIAMALALNASNSTLWASEPRFAAVTWNITEIPDNADLLLEFPKDAELMFSNNEADLSLPAIAKVQLARNVLATQRVSLKTQTMTGALSALVASLSDNQQSVLAAAQAPWNSIKYAVLGLAAAATGFFAVFLIALGLVSITSFSQTEDERTMYEAAFSTYSNRFSVGFLIFAAVVVLTCGLGIYFASLLSADQQAFQMFADFKFYAGQCMSILESVNSASNAHDRILKKNALVACYQSALQLADALLSSPSAYAIAGGSFGQIFGPQDTLTVRDLTSSTSATSCYNPANSANGNQQSLILQHFLFQDTVIQVASLQDNHLLNATVASGPLATLTAQARVYRPQLTYTAATVLTSVVSGMTQHYNETVAVTAALVALGLAVALLVTLMMVMPSIREIMRFEVGNRMLLMQVPEDVRAIPEISDFFEECQGNKADQMKKKLQQSEKLLQNILPPVISRRLKNGERLIADNHPNVTVIFAALIGFDEYSSRMEAKQIVHFLNNLIVTFDHITDVLELEKIKTIGDVYFLCGGLTKKTEADHPVRCMECAIFFMEAIEDNNRRNNTPNLMLMIGINTDPAVAGVIGSKKVAYDLWGDSVNTASRMESTGIPGKIQVSDKTYNFVKEYYSFTDRKVAAKGKGELPTHIFSGRIKPSPYKHINWRVNVEH
jgi:class 3 adenylate cyclase